MQFFDSMLISAAGTSNSSTTSGDRAVSVGTCTCGVCRAVSGHVHVTLHTSRTVEQVSRADHDHIQGMHMLARTSAKTTRFQQSKDQVDG